MAENYTEVRITSASISPQPVNANGKFTLAVLITEIVIVPQPQIYYSGEIYSGEV